MFKVKIADFIIEIHPKYQMIERMCSDYRVSDNENSLFSIQAEDMEIMQEKQQGDFGDYEICEALVIYRKICYEILNSQAFLMHSAVIAKDGEAYVFSAPSGTGKTTHIRLWQELFGDDVEVVNGDKPIFRFHDGVLYVYGTPWNGKEGMGRNMRCPVKAFAFIERNMTNQIRRLDDGEIITRIFHQVLMPNDEERLDSFMDTLERVMEKYPFYLLECNKDIEAAEVAYQKMRGEHE